MVEQINDSNAIQFFRNNPTVVIDCFASWCGPCKMFAPIFERVAQRIPNVKFVKIDIDQARAVASHLGVKSVPTIVIVKNNEVIFNRAGAPNEASLIELIKSNI